MTSEINENCDGCRWDGIPHSLACQTCDRSGKHFSKDDVHRDNYRPEAP